MINDDRQQNWIDEQNKLKQLISRNDYKNIDNIKLIGGVDISFDMNNPDSACAYLIVIDKSTKNVVYEDHIIVTMNVPYISGFLGFREVPHYLNLINKLKRNNPEFVPDVILVDGFGTLHHNQFGSASHLGVLSNISTIGCAKTLINMDGLNEKVIKEYMLDNKLNEFTLIGTSGIVHGVALITGNSIKNPIYVSIGHKITLNTATEIVKIMCIYRVPEPIRLADIRSKLYF